MLAVFNKVKAGALQFSILISVVIAVTISAFILLTHIQLKFSKQVEFSKRTVLRSREGITYARNYDISYNDSISLSFETKGLEDMVLIKKEHWGLFDKIISKGVVKNFTDTRVALLGESKNSLDRLALYLEGSSTPLVVAGDTRVTGNVVVSPRGVKAGNIVGNYYQGDALIYGAIRKIASSKPSLEEEKINYINNLLFNPTYLPQDDLIAFNSKISTHSFLQNPKWMYSEGPIDLTDQSVSNNIIIKSDSLIRVSAFAKAKNILLIAPHIIIEENATANLQAFASKSITVEENVRLTYPSALLLKESTQGGEKIALNNDGIVIRKGTLIEGSVVHLSINQKRVRLPKLTIAEGAKIKGEVYSDEWLELFGNVEGSVYASELAARVRGSVYKSHLFNAVINASLLPEEYSGLITSQSNKSVAQWVF